jgi:RHS repeat-associated protein
VFGHRYDAETQLYYLQSRYYNPEWGRFINADDITGSVGRLLSANTFAYCENNPIMNSDSSGQWFETLLDIACVITSFKDFISNPSWRTGLTLAYDCAATAVPGLPGSYIVKVADKASDTIKCASKASTKVGKTSFKDLLRDIENNSKNWKKISESVKNSTKKGNKGGKSIEEVYVNKKTGEKIYKHILKDASGKLIEKPHYRPYGKQ